MYSIPYTCGDGLMGNSSDEDVIAEKISSSSSSKSSSPSSSSTTESAAATTSKTYAPYVFTFGGALSTLSELLPEDYRPTHERVENGTTRLLNRLQDLSKVIFCNPFFAGINPGSCVLLHNASIQGLQG